MADMPAGDPFVENVLALVPPAVAPSLTPEQWDGFREALQTAASPDHRVADLRLTLPLYFTRLYCVLIVGVDSRERVQHILFERRRRALVAVLAAILAVFFLVATAVTLVALYIVKSAAGIDIFPGVHVLKWLEMP